MTLVIDSVALRPLAASVAWHLEGDDGARATVSAEVPGPAAEFPMLAPGHEFFAGFGQRRKAPPAPQRAGSAEMVITDSRTEVGSSPLTLRLSIEVLHYDTPEILLDLAGIPVDEV